MQPVQVSGPTAKWDIFAGESLTTKIGDAIDQCDAFVILMSSRSMTSKWVKEELRIALNKRICEDDFKLIPVLLQECNIHPFLRDYVYIDWRRGESIGMQSLLRALKQVSAKPDMASFLPAMSIRKVIQSITISGDQRDALFREKFWATSLREIPIVYRNLFYSGTLDEISSDLFEVERIFVTPTYEKLNLISKKLLPANHPFEFELNYRIRGCFSQNRELWFYAIESPTDLVRIEFYFEDTEPPETLSVKYRQGQSLYNEEVQPFREGHVILWEKAFPEYKDSYEFELIWRIVEQKNPAYVVTADL